MLRFSLDNTSPVPIYQQLKQSLLLEILSNRLKDGDRLPAIRGLAKILKLNPNTVAKVYYSLEDDGFIEGKRGSGYLVKTQKSRVDRLRTVIIEDELKSFLEKAFSLGFTKENLKKLIGRYLDNE